MVAASVPVRIVAHENLALAGVVGCRDDAFALHPFDQGGRLVVPDGQAALDHFAGAPEDFDLAITDHTMPGMTGFDVCAAVRADEAVRDTRILMLTAKGRETDVARGAGVGVDAYMTKPFSTRDLVAKIRELLA